MLDAPILALTDAFGVVMIAHVLTDAHIDYTKLTRTNALRSIMVDCPSSVTRRAF